MKIYIILFLIILLVACGQDKKAAEGEIYFTSPAFLNKNIIGYIKDFIKEEEVSTDCSIVMYFNKFGHDAAVINLMSVYMLPDSEFSRYGFPVLFCKIDNYTIYFISGFEEYVKLVDHVGIYSKDQPNSIGACEAVFTIIDSSGLFRVYNNYGTFPFDNIIPSEEDVRRLQKASSLDSILLDK